MSTPTSPPTDESAAESPVTSAPQRWAETHEPWYARCAAGYRTYASAPEMDMVTTPDENGEFRDIELPHQLYVQECNRFRADPTLIPAGRSYLDVVCGLFEGVGRKYLEVDKTRMVLLKTPLGRAFDRVAAARSSWGPESMGHMDLLARVVVYLDERHHLPARVVVQGSGGVPLPDAEFDYKGRTCNLEVECSTLKTKPEQVVKNLEKARALGRPCLFVVGSEDDADRLKELLREHCPGARLGHEYALWFYDKEFVEEQGDSPDIFVIDRQVPEPCSEGPGSDSPPRAPGLTEELTRVLDELKAQDVKEVTASELRDRLSPALVESLSETARGQLTVIGQAAGDLGVSSHRGWRGSLRVTLYRLRRWKAKAAELGPAPESTGDSDEERQN